VPFSVCDCGSNAPACVAFERQSDPCASTQTYQGTIALINYCTPEDAVGTERR